MISFKILIILERFISYYCSRSQNIPSDSTLYVYIYVLCYIQKNNYTELFVYLQFNFRTYLTLLLI